MRKPINTIEKMLTGKSVVIVALGDSLTSGWMVRKGYLDFLREALAILYPNADIRLLNAGSPGNTANAGLFRLRNDVLDHNPDCVLVQFGLNDVFCGYSPLQFAALMRKIVEEIRLADNTEIILLTSSYLGNNEQVELFYEQIEKIADEYALPFVAVHKHWQEMTQQGTVWDSLVQYDGVHPTVAGYELMAKAIMGVLTI